VKDQARHAAEIAGSPSDDWGDDLARRDLN
jgi:hypothetical protein